MLLPFSEISFKVCNNHNRELFLLQLCIFLVIKVQFRKLAVVSYLEDFRGRDEKAESRWQAGCKDTSSDEVVEPRNLAQHLVGIVIIKNYHILYNSYEHRFEKTECRHHCYNIGRRPPRLNGTFELLARPYLQDADWMHSVKFQPRLQPRPTQPSVMFPVRISLILPEASRITQDPGGGRRCIVTM